MSWATPFRMLQDGEIMDAGYGDIWVTPATAHELMNGGMTHVNGALVRLTIEDRMPEVNAVVIRWHPTETLEEIGATTAQPTVKETR